MESEIDIINAEDEIYRFCQYCTIDLWVIQRQMLWI